MKINSKIITNLFCLLYFLWGTFTLLYQAVNIPFLISRTFNNIFNILIILGLVICYFLLLQDLDFKLSIIAFFGVLVVVFFSVIPAEYQVGLGIILFTSSMFIIVGGNINFNSILKTFIWFSSIILCFTIIFNKFGIIADGITMDLLSIRTRRSLGFKYYSYPAHIIFYLIGAVVVYRGKKITYFELLVLEIANTWIYLQTDTRTSFLLSSFLISYALIKKIFHCKKGLIKFKAMRVIYSFSFLISFLLICIISFRLSSARFVTLNKLFSGRLSLNAGNFSRYGLALFGRNITFNTSDPNFYNYIDSAYLQILLIDGIVFFIVMMIMLTYTTIKITNEGNDSLAMVLFIISIFAMFDPQLIWAWYSPFCLLMGMCISLKSKKNRMILSTSE